MKIGVLSGAIKNAGDYLIVERGIKLIKKVFGEVELKVFNRLEPLNDNLDEINECVALFVVGGPAFLENVYPEYMPLVDDLDEIKPPIYTLGNGWFGKNNLPETIYSRYKFSDGSIRFLERIVHDNIGGISCRDWYTWRLLRANGIDNCIMTGCPAWYADDTYCVSSHRDLSIENINKICVSDPAYTLNIKKAQSLIGLLKIKYPKSEIKFLFHRGISNEGKKGEETAKLVEYLNKENINYVDISGRSDGFKEYDDCELHIGFRVHAHIYNISIHKVSILIEEDARGIGFNEAVGLTGVRPYTYEIEDESTKLRDNNFFEKECEDLLDKYLMASGGNAQFNDADQRIERTYEIMIKYLNDIKSQLI